MVHGAAGPLGMYCHLCVEANMDRKRCSVIRFKAPEGLVTVDDEQPRWHTFKTPPVNPLRMAEFFNAPVTLEYDVAKCPHQPAGKEDTSWATDPFRGADSLPTQETMRREAPRTRVTVGLASLL